MVTMIASIVKLSEVNIKPYDYIRSIIFAKLTLFLKIINRTSPQLGDLPWLQCWQQKQEFARDSKSRKYYLQCIIMMI